MSPSLLFCMLLASCLLGPSLPSALRLPHALSLRWMWFVLYIYIFFSCYSFPFVTSLVCLRGAQSSPSLCSTSFHHTSLFSFFYTFFFFTLLKSFFFLFSNTLCLSVARYILFKRHFIFFLKTIPSLSWPHNVGFKSSMCCRNLKLPRNVVACLSSHMFAVVHLVCSCSQELETFKKYLITNTFCVLSQRQLPGINVQTIWGRN